MFFKIEILTIIAFCDVLKTISSAPLPISIQNEDYIEERLHHKKKQRPCRLFRENDSENEGRTFFDVNLSYVSVNNHYNSDPCVGGNNQHQNGGGGLLSNHNGLLSSHTGLISSLLGGNGGNGGGPIATAIATAGSGANNDQQTIGPLSDTPSGSSTGSSSSSSISSSSQAYNGAGIFGHPNSIIGAYLDLFGFGNGNRPINSRPPTRPGTGSGFQPIKPVYEDVDDVRPAINNNNNLGINHKFIGSNNQLRDNNYNSNRAQRQFYRQINRIIRPVYRLF